MSKQLRSYAAILCMVLNIAAIGVVLNQASYAQTATVALQRGYRTGYSDGYMAGYRDSLDNATNDLRRHSDYEKANRAYNREFGPLEEYRDGYKQGFESGYSAGFGKTSFDAAIPTTLAKRGFATLPPPSATAVAAPEPAPVVQPRDPEPVVEAPAAPAAIPVAEPAPQPRTDEVMVRPTAVDNDTAAPYTPGTLAKPTFTPVSDAVIIIPKDTELVVELQDALSTETAREGDRISARVLSPGEITGSIVEGRVSKIIRPGRIKRRSEVQFTFTRIILTQDRWSNFDAQLLEVLPAKGDNVKRVDNEGMAQGDRPYAGDLTKIGAATGSGVVIGALAGGPVGAAVGAGVGAAFGVGAVLVERGKHINLKPNQQMRIRTTYETQIR